MWSVGVTEIVEHVGDTAGEGQHDDEEGDEEHEDILQHNSDAENDWPKVFGHDSRFYTFQNGQRESNAPKYSARRLHRCNIALLFGIHENIFQKTDDETNEKETVSDDVIVVPEGKISLLEPSDTGIRLL